MNQNDLHFCSRIKIKIIYFALSMLKCGLASHNAVIILIHFANFRSV